MYRRTRLMKNKGEMMSKMRLQLHGCRRRSISRAQQTVKDFLILDLSKVTFEMYRSHSKHEEENQKMTDQAAIMKMEFLTKIQSHHHD